MIYVFLLFLVIIIILVFSTREKKYIYKAKMYMMTRAEIDLYKKLIHICGSKYIVVPQAHLSAIFDHKIKGQNYKAAFFHINGKSVDYVLLDSRDYKIKYAIELDDYTHNQKDRIKRDAEVNRIFKEANLPLIRLKNTLNKDCNQIIIDITKQLSYNKHK